MNLVAVLPPAVIFLLYSIAGERETSAIWFASTVLVAILIELRRITAELRRTVRPPVKDVPHDH